MTQVKIRRGVKKVHKEAKHMMNPDHFRASLSGHPIKAGTGEMAYWAFVPHPLAPEIPPDWKLTCATSDADRALSGLAGVGRTMPNLHLLIGPFVRREAVLSSRIEGTQKYNSRRPNCT